MRHSASREMSNTPHFFASRTAPRLHAAALAIGLSYCVAAWGAAPFVAGTADTPLDPALKGGILVEELGCAACHRGNEALAARSKKAPRLAGIGARTNPAYLEAFLRDPHGTKPGTTMPDLPGQPGAEERKDVAAALTHFLLSLKGSQFSPRAPDAVAAARGQRLFQARGCVACHAPRDAAGMELPLAGSVPLGALEKKYDFDGLLDFLRRPLAVRPSGRMPDLLLKAEDAERITHFLLQKTRVPGSLAYTLYRGDVWEGLTGEKVTAEKAGLVQDFALASLGRLNQHSAVKYEGWINLAGKGAYEFFLMWNGGTLALDGATVATLQPSDRRGVQEVSGRAELEAGWHRIDLVYYHTGREPRFAFEMKGPDFARQTIPASMLSISREPIPVAGPFQVDATLAARGREVFGTMGCANCHDDLNVSGSPATEAAKLDPARGCLSTARGAWPNFDLSDEQRGWIAGALPRLDQSGLTDAQRVDKTLAQLNCIACHERAGLAKIPPERDALFTGTQPGLGNQGRLPPPLTGVGAKLQPAYIADVLLHGRRQRPYVDAAMPQFGETSVGHLVALFGRVDALESSGLPDAGPDADVKAAGHLMIGAEGFSCIACHEFNGQKPGELSALDIANTTSRLQRNWFDLFLLQPSRFHPTIIMPAFWPGGKSIRPNILDGDTGRQIGAIWAYLADGPRAKKPAGLSRQSNELRVSDVTEICRGQSPIGYRGMAVGYPGRINLAFDAGEMALRQLWKGAFVNIDLGRFNPRGDELITFPPGIPFHRLASLDESWPYKGKSNHAFPQDHGYRFRGYHLDAKRMPTLLYRYGDIAVEDFFEDVAAPQGGACFRRTLTFDAPPGRKPFYFRAAAGQQVARMSDTAFRIDRLSLRIAGDGHKGIVREGSPAEVLIPMNPPPGRSTLTLEYLW